MVEETVNPEKTTDLSQVTDKLYVVLSTGFELTSLVVKCTDCTCSCKSNYHTIATTTAPHLYYVRGSCSHRFVQTFFHSRLPMF